MEGEVGAQVAPPIFLHYPHPVRFQETLARKRDFLWQNPNFHLGPTNNWNPNLWQWDNVWFSAKPSPDPGSGQRSAEEAIKTQALGQRSVEEAIKVQALVKDREEDGGSLTLKLGVVAKDIVAATMSVARPSKRVRSGPPGGRGRSYPMCQVDDCQVDLTSAKDYHRRHKVCEVHSKITKVLVSQQMQRFCQQCSSPWRFINTLIKNMFSNSLVLRKKTMAGKGGKGLIAGKTTAVSKDKDKKRPASRSSTTVFEPYIALFSPLSPLSSPLSSSPQCRSSPESSMLMDPVKNQFDADVSRQEPARHR